MVNFSVIFILFSLLFVGTPIFFAGACFALLFEKCKEVNVAFGGSLHQHVHTVDGLRDHREDTTLSRAEQYAPVHSVSLVEGGVLHELAGQGSIQVNSLHGQGLDRLGDGLIVEGTSPDGLVEAVRVDADVDFAIGVQWHAEWRYWEDPFSQALFTAFGDAVRARAARRR